MCFYVSAGVEFAEFGHLSGLLPPSALEPARFQVADLADRPLLDQTSLVEPTIEMFSQLAILMRRRSSEMVERQSKSPIDIRWEGMLLVTELSNILSSGERPRAGVPYSSVPK